MWKKNQRILSRSEPELGIGLVTRLEGEKVLMVTYPRTQDSRSYNLAGEVPIQRFILEVGNQAFLPDGSSFKVEKRDLEEGLYRYSAGDQSYWEWELGDQTNDQGTWEFFINGNYSHHNTYDLRKQAWEIRGHSLSSRLRGLVGPRVLSLPHQLYIAESVSKRPRPRVLLADEVGLGKTIEAGLIFSAMRSLGRANKVLFLVPESLKHQWMAEMYRRFNELVTLLDEDRCLDEEGSTGDSPFESNQKILCSLEFFEKHPHRLTQALDVDWDLIIVDEAHHIKYNPQGDQSFNWECLKSLGEETRGLLFLTATPNMFGPETQFGLLNILDSQKFPDFSKFVDDLKHMGDVAKFAKTLSQESLKPEEENKVSEGLKKLFPKDESLIALLDERPLERARVNRALVDRHGTGRVLFRNRRARITGFPFRKPISVPFENSNELEQVLWLKEFCEKCGDDKVLVLCATKEQVQNIAKIFEEKFDVSLALFHDGLSIIERDKQAAKFAQDKNTQVLICSEIGGEGRNFQFCNKLVLFDIPAHPDLVEQRIGRLDRIGQNRDIEIYIHWLKGSKEELMYRWYQEGLNAFAQSWNGASQIFSMFKPKLDELVKRLKNNEPFSSLKDEVEELICNTQKEAQLLQKAKENSVDLLIDLNSFDKKRGDQFVEEVGDRDDDVEIEFFMKDLFDHYAIEYEDFDDRGSILVKGDSLSFIEDFPAISSVDDSVYAFDREVALQREDIEFISQDHKMVEECLAFLLERNEGVASVCKWPESPLGRGLLVEVSVILEASGPGFLELNRYLPLEQKTYLFNHQGEAIADSAHLEDKSLLKELHDSEKSPGDQRLTKLVAPIVEKAVSEAKTWAETKIKNSMKTAMLELQEEEDRLKYLATVNPNVNEDDIHEIQAKTGDTLKYLSTTKPHLDAIRIVFT